MVAENPNDSNAVIVIFSISLTQYFNCLKKKTHMYTVVVKQNEMEPAKDNETSQIIPFHWQINCCREKSEIMKV